ncbi:MAG: hypothetical protein E6G94_07760 [Alphaproteobacteria bacterium]|nr:MAG: hypothetical protein E6G94_07760 [Alphaproteobacteria bacterium]
MQRWRTKLLLTAGVAAALAAIPAFGQADQPESQLPPGFGDPGTPAPAPPPPPPAPDTAAAPEAPPPPPSALADVGTVIENSADADLAALGEDLTPVKPIEIPESARRPVDVVGIIGPADWGVGVDGFGKADGRFLSGLMRRLDAPLPSRWASILLRRVLMSEVQAPNNIDPVDWVAERAWLLLRMGEADAARMLVQSVDVDRFTPRMYTVGVQTALATADPAALCPLVAGGREVSDEAVWPLADAMCAALEGEAGRASALVDQARRRSGAGGIDLLLAEKVIGAGTNTRRAVNIQWDGVDQINAWRFGLASATGLAIPPALMASAGPQVRAWQARAPMVPLDQRLAAADTAASLGVFSTESLVELYSLVADSTDPSDLDDTLAGRLRRAYAAADPDARMSALRYLWDGAKTPEQKHARSILTAVASTLVAPSDDRKDVSAELIASMLAGGLDRQAARWAPVVESAGNDRAWALLAVGAPRVQVDTSSGRISTFAGNDDSKDKVRSRLLLAALAGLDRIQGGGANDLGADLGVNFAASNAWTRIIDSAAAKGQEGTVALLAAVGMQTGDWAGVPPEHLFHIVRALRQVGREYEARMIAAEALSRL